MFSRRVRSKDLVVLKCCWWASRRANSSDCFHATVPLCRRRLMNLIGLFITLLKAACTHCQVPSSQSPVLHFKQWRCRYPSSIICGCAPIFRPRLMVLSDTMWQRQHCAPPTGLNSGERTADHTDGIGRRAHKENEITRVRKSCKNSQVQTLITGLSMKNHLNSAENRSPPERKVTEMTTPREWNEKKKVAARNKS